MKIGDLINLADNTIAIIVAIDLFDRECEVMFDCFGAMSYTWINYDYAKRRILK